MQQMTQEGSVLQCQGELNKKISFRPCNVLSKAHRKLTLEVRRRAHRDSRLQRFAETTDPEQVGDEVLGRGARAGVWVERWAFRTCVRRGGVCLPGEARVFVDIPGRWYVDECFSGS